MVPNETVSRIQSLRERRGTAYGRSESRNITARSRIPQAGQLESTKTRAETKSQAFRLGPRGRRTGLTGFQHPHNDGVTAGVTAMSLIPALAVPVHIACLATDEGFIYFDLPAEFAAIVGLQCKTNPMEHVPCALLSDPKRPVDLPGANAVLHAGLHPNGNEPLFETECGVFHDGSNLDAELSLGMAILALPQATGSDVAHVLRSTGRTDNPILPFRAVCNEVANAIVGIAEIYYSLRQNLWLVVYFAHTSTLGGKG